MIIIHNKYLPISAVKKLNNYGVCLPFFSYNITNIEIACHPDIFLFPANNFVIAAPNTPTYFVNELITYKINIVEGNNPIGKDKEKSTYYNAVQSEGFIVHNKKYTDSSIRNIINNKVFIHVNQAYTRCSLLAIKDNCFITSDRGIEKTLTKNNLECLCISDQEIILPGYVHGFLGGCMGVYKDKVFIIGSLDFHSQGKIINDYLTGKGYEIISLYDGRFFDGGSLFFLDW